MKTEIQFQEEERVLNETNPKKTTPRHTATEDCIGRIKSRLKAANKSVTFTHKGTPIRQLANFWPKLPVRKMWGETFKVMKGKNL